MSGKKVVLLGDIGTDHNGFPPTPVTAGSPDVLIDGKPVARVGDPLAPHSKPKHPPHPRAIASGSSTVLINGIPAAVTGSAVSCGGVTIGSGSAVIGDSYSHASFSGISPAPVSSRPVGKQKRAVANQANSSQTSEVSALAPDPTVAAGSGQENLMGYATTHSHPQSNTGNDTTPENPGSTEESSDQEIFERAIRALEAEIANIGAHATVDGQARQAYARQIRLMADELRAEARSGRITWKQAAEQAEEARNLIMDMIRGRSTPVGRALAQQIKSEGKTLNELIGRKTQQLFGRGAKFQALTNSQQQAVYGAIVESAGKSNPKVSATMRRLSNAGKGLIVLSLGLSIYRIAIAEDKVDAAAQEAAITGAGIGGGMAGGAIAGLACGPGAPICVGVGAFVGGALAAFGVSFFW
jgi:uncharacterized Zn-binding protein involved in type VI secretion